MSHERGCLDITTCTCEQRADNNRHDAAIKLLDTRLRVAERLYLETKERLEEAERWLGRFPLTTEEAKEMTAFLSRSAGQKDEGKVKT